MQLKLAGKMKSVKGICFGEMVDCVQPGGQDYSLAQAIRNAVGDLNIPVGFGLRSGHISQGDAPNLCLPLGVTAKLEVAGDSAKLSSR
jgi:muramoyltetrapeptide carboxypeptidase LdcA involved in peptidoglycan recycling